MTLLAIRGANTATENTKDAITKATQELVREVMEQNSISSQNVVSILFTATADLNAEFPATAARALGLDDVPLMCAQEINVPGSMPRCIRLMMYVDVPKSKAQIQHIFLGDAKSLRKDISQTDQK